MTTRPDPQHVTIFDVEEDVDWLTLLQDEEFFQDVDILRLDSPPLAVGWGLVHGVFMMSDGVNAAILAVEQDYGYSNPRDGLDISVAIATQSTATVSVSDIEGYWQIDGIEHVDVLKLMDSEPMPFRSRSLHFQFTDIGNNQMRLDSAELGPLGVVDLDLEQNRITSDSVNGSGETHVFEMRTDGNTFSMVMVGTKSNDPRDVSLAIGLGHKVPAPTNLTRLALMQAALGTAGDDLTDLNSDGVVDRADVVDLLSVYGVAFESSPQPGSSTSADVPEPTAFALAALSLVGLMSYRRRRHR